MNLREFVASFAPSGSAGLQESIYSGGPGTYDPDELLTATTGGSRYFRRLTQSPRDLSPLARRLLARPRR